MTAEQTPVERAAEVLHQRWLKWAEEGVVAGPMDFCRTFAHDLATAGLLRDAEHDRRVKTEAWGEGYEAAHDMAHRWGHVDSWEDEPTNPYAERGE